MKLGTHNKNLIFSDYKYVIVGSGFFGSVIAERIANDLNEDVLIIEKNNHIGGLCYSEIHEETGILYHKYGTHIFHTSNEIVWEYINRFTTFNSYYHQVLTTHQDKVYQMPINLETINAFYQKNLKPYEVEAFLSKEIYRENYVNPENFEEKAISMLGRPLYEAFIKGYTTKQWQKDPCELPANILTRLPFRKNYNESYYYSKWQGIPTDGYTPVFNKMLSNTKIKILLNTDYFEIRNFISPNSKTIYTGPIDRFFNFKFGALEWRTLKLFKEVVGFEDFQGTSVMNYADEDIPYTRIHEPRHLHPERIYPKNKTLIIKEYSLKDDGNNPYYPINDNQNNVLLSKYREESKTLSNFIFSGRLGDFKYYDMDQSIAEALELYKTKIKYDV